METTEHLDLQVETLSGDIRDSLLTHLRDMRSGWAMMGERDQRAKIGVVERAAEDLVRKVVNLVSGTQYPEIEATVGPVKLDKGVEIKLATVDTVENITALAKHGKARAVLVLVDPKIFYGEREPAEVDPDEPTMDMPEPPKRAA
jgi:hypothetical protein